MEGKGVLASCVTGGIKFEILQNSARIIDDDRLASFKLLLQSKKLSFLCVTFLVNAPLLHNNP